MAELDEKLGDNFPAEKAGEYSPLVVSIKKSYSVVFTSKDSSIIHTSGNLGAQESLDLANKVSLELKNKGYVCPVDLSELPKEFKS